LPNSKIEIFYMKVPISGFLGILGLLACRVTISYKGLGIVPLDKGPTMSHGLPVKKADLPFWRLCWERLVE
jgi:hypothetical protein